MPAGGQETEKLGCYKERKKESEKRIPAKEVYSECRRESKSSPFVTTAITISSAEGLAAA